MHLERSDVDHPLWRKKVDRSLLQLGVTPLPQWVCAMWQITECFSGVSSVGDKNSEVHVVLKNGHPRHESYLGHVTCLTKGRAFPLFRLFLDDAVKTWLRNEYQMSYVRAIEAVLSNKKCGDEDGTGNSWEFLDIEYDRSQKTFYLVAHYKHGTTFPNLSEYLARTDFLAKLTGGNVDEKEDSSVLD